MQNPITKITSNRVVNQLVNTTSKFVLERENGLLTGITITFDALGIAVTYRNSPEIHRIISETKELLREEDVAEERKRSVYAAAFKEILPLVTPIILFFIGSTAAAIVNHKRTEAKIATLTAALSLAQTTIAEYDTFRSEVKEEIGEKKYNKIMNEVDSKQIANSSAPALWRSWRDAGYEIVWIPLIDYYFPSTQDKLEHALTEIDMYFRGSSDGIMSGLERYGNEIVTFSDVVRTLSKHTTDVTFEPYNGSFADIVGWEVGKTPYLSTDIGNFKSPNGMTGLAVHINTTPTYI